MPNLYLIDGVAGSGKSDFLQYCSAGETVRKFSDKKDMHCFLIKPTTKDKEKDGVVRQDLEHMSEDKYCKIKTAEDFEYRYPKTIKTDDAIKLGPRYLIQRNKLDEMLRIYNDVFVIVRSSAVIKKIKKAYKHFININVVSIFIYCDNEKLATRTREQIEKKDKTLSEEKIKEQINVRLARNQECIDSYIQSLSEKERIYDYVILNDVEHEKFYHCIDQIRDAYRNFDDKFQNPTAFVIMPMPDNREAAHFFKVKEAIYEGAKEVGFVALRQDDAEYSQETILKNIRKSIDDATICIADLTNSRPNCYFETGLAYAKNANNPGIPNVFLLIQAGEKIEFDLSGVSHSKYDYIPNDYDHIKRLVSKFLKTFTKEHIFITERHGDKLKV